MKHHGLESGPQSVIQNLVSHLDIYQAVRQRMDGPTPPTAVVAINDHAGPLHGEKIRERGHPRS